MNQYLIPANSKKGQLIFNIFRPIDLAVLLIGACITLILMLVFTDDDFWLIVLKLLPIGLSALLVMPLAYYHNVLVFLEEAIIFYSKELNGQNRYHWKGWCATHVIDGERKK